MLKKLIILLCVNFCFSTNERDHERPYPLLKFCELTAKQAGEYDILRSKGIYEKNALEIISRKVHKPKKPKPAKLEKQKAQYRFSLVFCHDTFYDWDLNKEITGDYVVLLEKGSEFGRVIIRVIFGDDKDFADFLPKYKKSVSGVAENYDDLGRGSLLACFEFIHKSGEPVIIGQFDPLEKNESVFSIAKSLVREFDANPFIFKFKLPPELESLI